MALNLADRLTTVAVTALVTSAAWAFSLGVDLSGLAGSAGTRITAVAGRERGEAPGAQAPAAHPTQVVEPSASEAGEFMIPVAGIKPSQLSDNFSDARGGGSRLHEAIDIMAPTGTPVLAAAAGRIEKLFKSEEGGNTVYVRSADGRTIQYYAHLDRYAAGLREGQTVKRGEALGTVGWSGNASPDAPHLHFAVMRTTPAASWWDPATSVNPYPLLVGR